VAASACLPCYKILHDKLELLTPGVFYPALTPRGQVFGRASKYSLFDPCKEMLFITMTDKRVSVAR
jgi:hypothetical protein